jgi:phosphatidate cytidylyltransferase
LSDLFRRTITAVWIVLFILGGFWLHPVSFLITGFVIMAGCQYEYYQIIKRSGVDVQMINGIITGAVIYIVSSLIAAGYAGWDFYLVLFPLVFLMMVAELYRKKKKPLDSLAQTFFAVIWISIPFSLFPFSAFSRIGLSSILHHGNIVFSPGIIIGFLLLLWANDTGAYLLGVLFGKHRLMERISPKKSWEGFAGGLIITILAAWLLSGWLGVVKKGEWVIISVIISIAGTYGDLFESMFKRSNDVKDSGTILPGHGGLLDRFDSAIVSFPLVYLFISLFG